MYNIDFVIGRLLMKAGNALNNIRLDDLKKYNLTLSQSETILYFANNDGKNIKDLALHLRVTHQAARKLVDKLKEKDILSTTVSKNDKRSVQVFLTEKGEKLYTILKNNVTATGEILFKGFSEEEKEQLLEQFKRMENIIDMNYTKRRTTS